MLEGGGQILRNAASLSAVTRQSITVTDIRAKRSKPGLRPQHLTGVQLVSSLCGGTCQGCEVGSTEITLTPGDLQCTATAAADTGTAGSVMLLAQVALPCLLFARPETPSSHTETTSSKLELKGGTDAAMAPPVDYTLQVLLPTLRAHLHIQADIVVHRRGFFPKGNGLVTLTATALPPNTCLPPITLTSRGSVTEIRISAFTAGNVKSSVGDRMIATARNIVQQRVSSSSSSSSTTSSLVINKLDDEPPIQIVEMPTVHEPRERAFGDGCGMSIVAKTSTGCVFGAAAVGERGVTAETLGQRAADEMMDVLESGACVDDWMMDQLIIFMALAQGASTVVCREPTLHSRTAIAVAEKLIPSAAFKVERIDNGGGERGLWKVTCRGGGIVVAHQNDDDDSK